MRYLSAGTGPGTTSTRISRIGLGAWQFGSPEWGYGKEYAAAIPGAEFRMVPAAGHLPQLENQETVLGLFGELVTADGYQ